MPGSQGIVKTDPMNSTKGRVPHNYSTFSKSLSYKKNILLRYADYTPSFEMEGVQKDDIRLNTKDVIDSLSLNAPFKGTIRKIKESFKVPNMAMLPFNWDLIYTQPSVGGDVPADANTVLLNFPTDFSDFWKSLVTLLVNNAPTASSTDAQFSEWITGFLRVLVLGEYVYSDGSLLNCCGYKASAQFNCIASALADGSYDTFFDFCINSIFSEFVYLEAVSNSKVYRFRGLASVLVPVTNFRYLSAFRNLLELFRENPASYIQVSSAGAGGFSKTSLASRITALFGNVFDLARFEFILPPATAPVYSESELTELNPNVLNYQRLLAYQLIYFHFYTNSSIDPIYSADLFRQYVASIIRAISTGGVYYSFTLNGRSLYYDFLSGCCIARCTYLNSSGTGIVTYTYSDLVTSSSTPNAATYRFVLFSSIFAYRHSLRYGDYFVGSRPRPIAPVQSDSAPVVSNSVSVIDITQRQWAQRFGNAVMRSRQKVENYVDMLFGRKPDIDYHNPLFLSREVDVVYGDEVQNTANEQATNANSRTANMRGGLGQFTFTFHNDDMHPCVYMQIISFDIKRAYTRSVDRQFLHVDRYDMFNPDFQYIGDQPIYGIELGYPANVSATPLTIPAVFGYQGRDMEYKQRFDVCVGGFNRNLPGWVLTDVDRSRMGEGQLSADFIRNYNSELDQFFLSLTGFSLGNYFHFVCMTQNNVYAKRAMAYDPQLLG